MSTQAQLFDTPEAAAMSGFPAEHCRVVASAADRNDAYVLLDTGAHGNRYLYGVNVHRREGGWEEGSSGNGPGWTVTDPDHDIGTLAVWGEAPDGADRVQVVLGEDAWEATIADGVYLVAWWRVPCPDEFPREVGFRVDGDWVAADE